MRTALLFLCLLGIACAFSVKNFRRRFKAEDSEENAVFKNRFRYFLYRYPYHYPPMKRYQFNSDSSEEGYGGESSEEGEEEEGGQSNEENEGGTENETEAAATEAPPGKGTVIKGHAKPPKQVPARKDPVVIPGKGGGIKKGEKDKAPEQGGKKEGSENEEDSDENEEEENEEEENEEEEKAEENEQSVNGTSTNSTAEENGNGGNGEEEEEGNEEEAKEATTVIPTTVATTVISTTDYQEQYETTTEDQGQYVTPEDPWQYDTTTEDPYAYDTTTAGSENGYETQTDYYGNEHGEPRGDTFRTYEDEYSYYKGHGYDVYGQDYYYNQ
ncbi:PREDICTED: bone sialoprotein 2 [Gekko japonicus]|uniref:Integrin-binding sialoprotein n=1 Tax=Gekko japonicus TaxID=146911 RepID=A0ABM1JZC8_GEKJA|nr:PREDICTED: bone sialoprotein 2 [Gekko japonicus]